MIVNESDLVKKAHWVWRETLAINRRAPETRIASSLSCVEIFVALYYGDILEFRANEPYWDGRDRCVISKGHGSICMYPILADLGYFDFKELETVCKAGSFLGGIPDPIIPGYETLNGSLGHGLGVGAGMALGLKTRENSKNIFVICGDGELHEGSNWEAIMFAGHHGLDNLNLILDDNKTSMLDHTKNIISHGNIGEKFSTFGWETFECDGHDVHDLQNNLAIMKKQKNGRPKLLVANTIKGKGVPDLENKPLAHIISPKTEQLDELLTEKNDD